jgi:hypothetical protein
MAAAPLVDFSQPSFWRTFALPRCGGEKKKLFDFSTTWLEGRLKLETWMLTLGVTFSLGGYDCV